MDLIRQYPIRRFESGKFGPVADAIISEARIELDVNDGQLHLAMLCLPQELEALAVGFLMGEGALRRAKDLQGVEFLPAQSLVRIRGDFDSDVLERIQSRWTFGSGCGRGGTGRDMNALSPGAASIGPAVPADRLVRLGEAFRRCSGLWQQTGGVHSCALADGESLLVVAEDTGRHNAFDKVIGKAVLAGADPSGKMMMSTGRLSADIVAKALACGVPIVASRAAATSLAIDLARRFGVTLVGFLRGSRFNVYTGFERIAPPEDRP